MLKFQAMEILVHSEDRKDDPAENVDDDKVCCPFLKISAITTFEPHEFIPGFIIS